MSNTHKVDLSEVQIIHDEARTIYVSHPEASYGIFCWNSKGDLFLSSDWGFYGYSWRAFGTGPFNEWLKGLNAGYIADKFAYNWNMSHPPKQQFGGRREKCIIILCEAFIKALKETPVAPELLAENTELKRKLKLIEDTYRITYQDAGVTIDQLRDAESENQRLREALENQIRQGQAQCNYMQNYTDHMKASHENWAYNHAAIMIKEATEALKTPISDEK